MLIDFSTHTETPYLLSKVTRSHLREEVIEFSGDARAFPVFVFAEQKHLIRV